MLSPAKPQETGKTAKLSWRAKARLRAGWAPRKRGGQPRNINRMTHGRYSAHYRARRAATWDLVRSTNALIARIKLAAKLGFPLQLCWRGLSEAKGAGLARKRLDTTPSFKRDFVAYARPRAFGAPPPASLEGGGVHWPKISKTAPSRRAYAWITGEHL